MISEIVIRPAKRNDAKDIVLLWEKTRKVHEALDSYWVAKKGSEKLYFSFMKKQILSKEVCVVVADKFPAISA